MKNSILKTKELLFFCLFISASFLYAQTTHIVNNNGNTSADFTGLQAAIDAAANGDIIYVQQSATSYGNITIDKGVTIIGRSNGDASYKSEVGSITLDAGASNASIKGLKISQVSEAGNTSTITDISFFDNDITSTFQLGSTDTFNNLLLQGNIIRGTLYIYDKTSNVLITNNIILSNSLYFYMTDTLLFSNNVFGYYVGVGIYNYSSSQLNISNSIFIINYFTNRNVSLTAGSGTIQVDNCISYNYDASGNCNFATGAGITINANVQENIDPLFTSVNSVDNNSIAGASSNFDPINDNLTLQGSSTVFDDGIFEGYNFSNFGTPTGYPSIKVLANSATVPKNGNLSVTIEAKTN